MSAKTREFSPPPTHNLPPPHSPPTRVRPRAPCVATSPSFPCALPAVGGASYFMDFTDVSPEAGAILAKHCGYTSVKKAKKKARWPRVTGTLCRASPCSTVSVLPQARAVVFPARSC